METRNRKGDRTRNCWQDRKILKKKKENKGTHEKMSDVAIGSAEEVVGCFTMCTHSFQGGTSTPRQRRWTASLTKNNNHFKLQNPSLYEAAPAVPNSVKNVTATYETVGP